MTSPPALHRPGFSRRALLAGALGTAALVLLASGCTADGDDTPALSQEATDRLADQVAVQEAAVAAYATAATADPALGAQVASQAEQALAQLDRLRAAAPGAGSPTPVGAQPPAGTDVRSWLRERLDNAAASHEAACADQVAARAALLGSVAAGLRGQAAVLA